MTLGYQAKHACERRGTESYPGKRLEGAHTRMDMHTAQEPVDAQMWMGVHTAPQGALEHCWQNARGERGEGERGVRAGVVSVSL